MIHTDNFIWPTDVDDFVRTGDRGSSDIVKLIKMFLADMAKNKVLRVELTEVTYKYSVGVGKIIKSMIARLVSDKQNIAFYLKFAVSESVIRNCAKDGFMAHRYPKGYTLKSVYQANDVYFCVAIETLTNTREKVKNDNREYTPAELKSLIKDL